jgi:hypothetical protein
MARKKRLRKDGRKTFHHSGVMPARESLSGRLAALSQARRDIFKSFQRRRGREGTGAIGFLNLLENLKPVDRSFAWGHYPEAHALATYGQNFENNFIADNELFPDSA